MVELIIAIVIFSVAVLGMAQTGLVAFQQARAGDIATKVWAAAQLQLEEFRQDDFASLATGSGTVAGYPATWTVTGTDPKTVTLAITRPSVLGGQAIDSFVVVRTDW